MGKQRDIVERLRLAPHDIGGPSRMGMIRERAEAADEIEKLRMAVTAAMTGFGLAYEAASKGLIDEVLLHCGHHEAQMAKEIGK